MFIDGVTGSASQHSLSDYKQAEIPADGDGLLSEQQMLPAAHKVSDDEEQFRLYKRNCWLCNQLAW